MKRMFGVMYTGINAESTQGLRDHDVGCDRTCAWDTRSTNLSSCTFFRFARTNLHGRARGTKKIA